MSDSRYHFFNDKEMEMRKLSVTFGVLMIVLLLSGCHTMQGFGKDIQKGGEVIEKSAQ
jgi:predicted small secreted protein